MITGGGEGEEGKRDRGAEVERWRETGEKEGRERGVEGQNCWE